jgi:hypothetical protein
MASSGNRLNYRLPLMHYDRLALRAAKWQNIFLAFDTFLFCVSYRNSDSSILYPYYYSFILLLRIKLPLRFKFTLQKNAIYAGDNIDPFDGAQATPFKTGKKTPLRVNPEPLTRALTERQEPTFKLGRRRVDF